MKLKTAVVRFFHHKLHGIVIGKWCFALRAGQPLAPRLKRRWVKGIGSRSYLANDGIHAITFVHVQLADVFPLLCFRVVVAAIGPVYIVNGGHPYAAEFRNRRLLGSSNE